MEEHQNSTKKADQLKKEYKIFPTEKPKEKPKDEESSDNNKITLGGKID